METNPVKHARLPKQMITWIPTILRNGTPSLLLLSRTGSGRRWRGEGGGGGLQWWTVSLSFCFLVITTCCCFPLQTVTLLNCTLQADNRNHFPQLWVCTMSFKRQHSEQLHRHYEPVKELSLNMVEGKRVGFSVCLLQSEMESQSHRDLTHFW